MAPKIGNFFLRSLRLLAIYRSCLLFNSMPARVHPLDFLGPDGLELLRRNRRGRRINSNHEGILAVAADFAKMRRDLGMR
jgi:hypothetical protein